MNKLLNWLDGRTGIRKLTRQALYENVPGGSRWRYVWGSTLTFTFAGIWEIQPEALEESGATVQIIDVREPDEFEGPLGRIRNAKLIPLGELSARAAELARDRPVVTVCRSGARSAQASVLLQKSGFADVANLAGGMLRWRAEGHPVEGARE